MNASNSSSARTPKPVIYIITSGAGITGTHIVNAVLAQFPENRIPMVLKPDIADMEGLEKAVNEAINARAIVVHTMVVESLRKRLIEMCREKDCFTFDLMGGLINKVSEVLDIEPLNKPGLFRKSHTEYFDRLESMDFAIDNDDGLNVDGIFEADIVLTGVSRTGKTPLSMYLAMHGWKVTNIPLIRGIEPPEELFRVDHKRVFGLTINLSQLQAHRTKRLGEYERLNGSDYLNPRHIREELDYALSIFKKGRFSIINVTNKPIESTANEILKILSNRFDRSVRKLKRDMT